jgi:hypothetical protein
MKKVVLHLASILTAVVILSGIMFTTILVDANAAAGDKRLHLTLLNSDGSKAGNHLCFVFIPDTGITVYGATNSNGSIHFVLSGAGTLVELTCYDSLGNPLPSVSVPLPQHTTRYTLTLT